MATPAPAPAPTPTPAPTPAPAPTLTPGWKTSEAWLSLLVSLPGIILNSGLVTNATELTKICTLAASVLAALGYTQARAAIKKAHYAHLSALALVPANDNAKIEAIARSARAGLVRLKMMLVLSAVTLTLGIAGASLTSGCATVQKMTGAFAGCEKSNLGAVLSNIPTALASDLTTAGTSASEGVFANCAALMRANLPGLETDLETIAIQVGEVTFGCIWTAIEAVLGPSTDPATKAGLARARAWQAKRATR
jgi:hypothetical protein